MQPQILFPHTAIYTPNLEASLKFYRAFFGVEPKKIKPGYAKFELENPKWNFTLNEVRALVALVYLSLWAQKKFFQPQESPVA